MGISSCASTKSIVILTFVWLKTREIFSSLPCHLLHVVWCGLAKLNGKPSRTKAIIQLAKRQSLAKRTSLNTVTFLCWISDLRSLSLFELFRWLSNRWFVSRKHNAS
jgi:hypothetical protein